MGLAKDGLAHPWSYNRLKFLYLVIASYQVRFYCRARLVLYYLRSGHKKDFRAMMCFSIRKRYCEELGIFNGLINFLKCEIIS